MKPGKRFSEGEFIKDCLMRIVENMMIGERSSTVVDDDLKIRA